MIAKLDIGRFGLFIDYTWGANIGGDQNDYFAKMNIIYGRNYSGKTTLSRILRCVERKQLHENYQSAKFSITLKSAKPITSESLAEAPNDLHIRVYNSDFVRDNLSWLHNSDGTIRPFTILGAKNVDIDKRIKEIEEKLGSAEARSSLTQQLAELTKAFESRRKALDAAYRALDGKLRTKAQQIKNVANLYGYPTYNIATIKAEISKARQLGVQPDTTIEERKKILRDEPKPSIGKLKSPLPDFSALFSTVRNALRKKITPSEPLKDLVNDFLLQEWVRQGIEKHRGKRQTCGFCGNELPKDLWKTLDAHFNQESESLRRDINDLIGAVRSAYQETKSIVKLSKQSFYNSLHASFDIAYEEWLDELGNVDKICQQLIGQLEKRLADIFNEILVDDLPDKNSDLQKKIIRLNELIDHNNQKTSTLELDQRKAQEELRLGEVARFINDIRYDDLVEEIQQLEGDKIVAEQEKNKMEVEVQELLDLKKSLETQLHDESRGAALVNDHLSNFFGHDELKLVPDGNKPNMKFKIVREGTDAKNLSEGECSLISFCYFIAKIEDELKDPLVQNKLVIYIDDPISSLDSNHIFFMFSLIEGVIAKPKKYAQLFISTHNLDFFKYIKRLTTPDGKNSVSYYLIESRLKKTERRSFLIKMPSYLRDYVTEFNYLFNEIYKVYKAVQGDRKRQIENTFNQFYNLPNNLRKFLECYLFFRYPNTNSPLDNLSKLFDGNIPALINRVIHEYSHLTYIERGWMPMDVGEAEECAKIVIEKIREKDKDQFDALVGSIS